MLNEKLHAVSAEDLVQVQERIAELSSDDYKTRETASAELAKAGTEMVLTLEQVLDGKPTLELRRRVELLLDKLSKNPSSEYIRKVRAVEVLELIRTEEARNVLRSLSKGAPQAWLTAEAQAALRRMSGND